MVTNQSKQHLVLVLICYHQLQEATYYLQIRILLECVGRHCYATVLVEGLSSKKHLKAIRHDELQHTLQKFPTQAVKRACVY
jgi:hypothetical protein